MCDEVVLAPPAPGTLGGHTSAFSICHSMHGLDLSNQQSELREDQALEREVTRAMEYLHVMQNTRTVILQESDSTSTPLLERRDVAAKVEETVRYWISTHFTTCIPPTHLIRYDPCCCCVMLPCSEQPVLQCV